MASAALGQVYMIPAFIDEESPETIPAYVLDAVKECNAFFVACFYNLYNELFDIITVGCLS